MIPFFSSTYSSPLSVFLISSFFFPLRRDEVAWEGGCFNLSSATKLCKGEGGGRAAQALASVRSWVETAVLFWGEFPVKLPYWTLVQFAGWFWYTGIKSVLPDIFQPLKQTSRVWTSCFSAGGDTYPRKQVVCSFKKHMVQLHEPQH